MGHVWVGGDGGGISVRSAELRHPEVSEWTNHSVSWIDVPALAGGTSSCRATLTIVE